jgi:hypothetical protein
MGVGGLLKSVFHCGTTPLPPSGSPTDTGRVKAKPAVEELFKKEWPVTTWTEVLAQ